MIHLKAKSAIIIKTRIESLLQITGGVKRAHPDKQSLDWCMVSNQPKCPSSFRADRLIFAPTPVMVLPSVTARQGPHIRRGIWLGSIAGECHGLNESLVHGHHNMFDFYTSYIWSWIINMTVTRLKWHSLVQPFFNCEIQEDLPMVPSCPLHGFGLFDLQPWPHAFDLLEIGVQCYARLRKNAVRSCTWQLLKHEISATLAAAVESARFWLLYNQRHLNMQHLSWYHSMQFLLLYFICFFIGICWDYLVECLYAK